MRIVYDDTMQGELVAAVEKFMASFDVKRIVQYEYGMDRVQMHSEEKLNLYLEHCRMSIGNKVTHAHGIGNNCQYPVYYYPEGSDEIRSAEASISTAECTEKALSAVKITTEIGSGHYMRLGLVVL